MNSSQPSQPQSFDQPTSDAMMEATPFHPSAIEAIGQLRARFPDAPFLTLGQTVLWDEPVKAAFCRILEAVAPDAPIVAAVHDTDYFAKLAILDAPASAPDGDADADLVAVTSAFDVAVTSAFDVAVDFSGASKFAMMGHNDGATRGLWSAAGELSCLFGAEIVPSRGLLAESGVAFDRVARDYEGGADALLNRETQAWGWRALVHAEPHPLIAADVKLRDIGPLLRAQLQWGFAQSLAILDDATSESEGVARQISDWIHEYSCAGPDNTLSDLYQWLTPRLWGLVRGGGGCNLQSDHSMQMFRFNRETAHRKRFAFVDLFLRRETRDSARECYDDAVRGSGIYTLAQFGEGALPFDVVIPGQGRGTLRLHEGSLYIETAVPITLCTGCDCASIQELAGALEDRFGPDVALVGKAVALISMLAAEYIFVFHEKASGYTSRTQVMNESLRARGIELPLHPMLKVKYATWNALKEVDARFSLPPHLAQAFGTKSVSASEFATRWETVCEQQDELRARLKACHSPRDLMTFLAQRASDSDASDSDANNSAPNGENANADDANRDTNRLLATDEAALPEKALPEKALPEAASSADTSKSLACAQEAALHEYSVARAAIRALRARAEGLERETASMRQSAREATQRAGEIERAKGVDWRAVVQPLRTRLFDLKEQAAARLAPPIDARTQIPAGVAAGESISGATVSVGANADVVANGVAGDVVKLAREEKREKARLEAEREAREAGEIADLRARIAACIQERAHFDQGIAAERGRAAQSSRQARARIQERVALEKSPASQAARATIARLEIEAEWARLLLTRDAILVSQGLRLTNYRPTAWWFPLVSPDGQWFRTLAQTAQARIEEL